LSGTVPRTGFQHQCLHRGLVPDSGNKVGEAAGTSRRSERLPHQIMDRDPESMLPWCKDTSSPGRSRWLLDGQVENPRPRNLALRFVRLYERCLNFRPHRINTDSRIA